MFDIPSRLSEALAGRYRVERQLGAGGMATVYLAQDLRHDRQVAIKVLRPELAAVLGAERFLAEIKTTANLQHPHILPLFDSGEADGFLFYVMPFVEGESLRERLTRETQLPVDEGLRTACEVAEALQYAHQQGVIHRDIKPENVLLHGGHALVADFGIALAVTKIGGTRLTETGLSLGTPAYMAPEQAMGEREITPKADVYALGCVLYEMLAGEPPFAGPTAQAIVARAMTEAPRPLATQRPTVPAHVVAAVEKALQKLPADRFVTAGTFAAALATPATTAGAVAAGGPRRAGSRGRWARLRSPLGVAFGVVLGAALWAVARPAPGASVHRYGLALPDTEAPDPSYPVIPSPDGSRLAYLGPAAGGKQVWIKPRDRYDATPLDGTTGATDFTWSPDGQWIAFLVDGHVEKIPAAGGAPTALADSAYPRAGLAWLDDGTIVFDRDDARGLRRVSAAGGSATTVWTDSVALGVPIPLPGGRGVLFGRCPISCGYGDDLWALDLRSGRAHMVLANASRGWVLPGGMLVYVRPDGAVLAVPFDLRTLGVSGSAITVTDGVSVLYGYLPLAAVSRSGTIVVRLRGAAAQGEYQMVWVDRTGRESPVDKTWTFAMAWQAGWALSPDGTRLAIGLATRAGDDIWVKQLPHGPLSRVSYDSAREYRPRWLAGGRSVMFLSDRARPSPLGLYRRSADGTGSDSLVVGTALGIWEGEWSPDGNWLLVRAGSPYGHRDILGLRPGIDTALSPLVATPYDAEAIALSPDGRWLAYQSDETGRDEVFMRPFPKTESGKWQVSSGGGIAPLWARDGRELFYVNQNRDMTSVTVGPGAEPRLGAPRVLFHMADDLYLHAYEDYTPFDVASDGRFIMARAVTPSSEQPGPLIVMDNWSVDIRSREQGGR
jgi:hypothetical protein